MPPCFPLSSDHTCLVLSLQNINLFIIITAFAANGEGRLFLPNNHNQTPVKKQTLYKIQTKYLHVCTTEKMFEFFVYYTVYSFENFHVVQRLQILCLEALDLFSASTGSYEFPLLVFHFLSCNSVTIQ